MGLRVVPVLIILSIIPIIKLITVIGSTMVIPVIPVQLVLPGLLLTTTALVAIRHAILNTQSTPNITTTIKRNVVIAESVIRRLIICANIADVAETAIEDIKERH
jgi:hypothetical protein